MFLPKIQTIFSPVFFISKHVDVDEIFYCKLPKHSLSCSSGRKTSPPASVRDCMSLLLKRNETQTKTLSEVRAGESYMQLATV